MLRAFSLAGFFVTRGYTGSKQKIFFFNKESLVTTFIDVENIPGNIIYLTRSFSLTSNLLPRISSVVKFKFLVSRLYLLVISFSPRKSSVTSYLLTRRISTLKN